MDKYKDKEISRKERLHSAGETEECFIRIAFGLGMNCSFQEGFKVVVLISRM